jgi:hypothetical protein
LQKGAGVPENPGNRKAVISSMAKVSVLDIRAIIKAACQNKQLKFRLPKGRRCPCNRNELWTCVMDDLTQWKAVQDPISGWHASQEMK